MVESIISLAISVFVLYLLWAQHSSLREANRKLDELLKLEKGNRASRGK